jgi:hypothetical protein
MFSSSAREALTNIFDKQDNSISTFIFSKQDRERVLELLLSDSRVVTNLYASSSPERNRNSHLNTSTNNELCPPEINSSGVESPSTGKSSNNLTGISVS